MKAVKRIFLNLFFTPRFGFAIAMLVLLFIIGYWLPFIYSVAKVVFVLFLGYCAFEIYVLFAASDRILASRKVPNKLSNGDLNEIKIDSKDLGISGLLYYQLESNEKIATKKMIVLPH